MHTSIKSLFLAPALVLAAACSKDKPADAALSNDLTLAAQAQKSATLDSISAAERTRAAAAAAPVAAPVALRTGTAPVHHAAAVHHRARSSGSYSGSFLSHQPCCYTAGHSAYCNFVWLCSQRCIYR